MKPNDNQTLWKRIETFSIDDPLAGFTFSRKLAAQNGWTLAFTAKAIAEYKRFIFLCCISPTGASPSPIVDEVWHLHLTYTHNYWKEFCGQTLHKEIHHHPSKGGAAEADKHRNWYAETLALYRDVFEGEPPAEIWPQPEAAATTSSSKPAEVPQINYTEAYWKYAYVLLLPFLFPLAFGKFHPFALKGPQFLWFYGILLAATLLYFFLVGKIKEGIFQKAVNDFEVGSVNSFQMARYVFGKNKAIEAAVVDFVAKGILIAERREQFSFYPAKMDAATRHENPLAATLLQRHSGTQALMMKDMISCYNDNLTSHAGLAELYQTAVKRDWPGYIISILVLLLAIARIKQGLNNGYPVTYLQIMLVFGFLFLLIAVVSLSSKKMLQEVFIKRHGQDEFAHSGEERLLQKFLFLGVASITGTFAFANLEATFKRHTSPSSSDGGSGCSSGCGSSCGGGCGGGCGGCGGGD